MIEEKIVRGTHFTCFHAGPKEGWTQFRLEPPDVPIPTKGKLFLRNLLGSAGLEMSLNVVPPGKGIPFLHRHQENDELYVVVGGQGQFLVNGVCIDVNEGSALRISPTAARAADSAGGDHGMRASRKGLSDSMARGFGAPVLAF